MNGRMLMQARSTAAAGRLLPKESDGCLPQKGGKGGGGCGRNMLANKHLPRLLGASSRPLAARVNLRGCLRRPSRNRCAHNADLSNGTTTLPDRLLHRRHACMRATRYHCFMEQRMFADYMQAQRCASSGSSVITDHDHFKRKFSCRSVPTQVSRCLQEVLAICSSASVSRHRRWPDITAALVGLPLLLHCRRRQRHQSPPAHPHPHQARPRSAGHCRQDGDWSQPGSRPRAGAAI